MKTHTENAIQCLEEGNFQGYFDALDAAEMPAHLKPIYAELKSKFMQGIKTHDFSQQLVVFAKETIEHKFENKNDQKRNNITAHGDVINGNKIGRVINLNGDILRT